MFFSLGSYYFEKVGKSKKPSFSTRLKRSLLIIFENITAGIYFILLFDFFEEKKFMDKKYLFLIFLFVIFISGFILEFILAKIGLFEIIRNNFYIWFYSLILVFYFYLLIKTKNITIIICLIALIIIQIIIKKYNIAFLFISDFVIFAGLIFIFYDLEEENIIILNIFFVFIFIYKFVEFLMFRIELKMWFFGILVNILLLLSCFCISDKKKKKLIRFEEEINSLSKKNNLSNDNLTTKEEDKYGDFYNNQQISSINYFKTYESKEEENCVERAIKNLIQYINRENKKEKIMSNKIIPNIKGNYDDLYKIIEKLEEKDDEFDLINDIKQKI